MSNRNCVLGAIFLLFASGCELGQAWATPGDDLAVAAQQAVQAFATDFARQVLAALLL